MVSTNGTVAKQGLWSGVRGLFNRTRVAPTQRAGTGGTAIWSGYVQTRERSADLTGTQRYTTISDILANVCIVAAAVRMYMNLVARAGWSVEPAEVDGKNSSAADEVADFVESAMYDMKTTPWSRVIRRAASYRLYGFSTQEWIAKRRKDGRIGMAAVEPRPQKTIERWDVDEKKGLVGVEQRSPQTMSTIYLPREKLVYLVDDSLDDSPEGLGLFRHIIDRAQQLRLFEELEGIGFEDDLRGTGLGRAPLSDINRLVESGEMKAEEKAEALQPFRDFFESRTKLKHKDSKRGFLLDSKTYNDADGKPSSVYQQDMSLLQGGSNGQEAVANAIRRLNWEIAVVFGVEQILLGERGAGSLALSKDKSQHFGLNVDSALTEISEAFEQDFVGRLLMLNGIDEELAPTLKPEKVQLRDVEQVASTLETMSRAGAVLMPDDPAVGVVRDLLGVPRPITVNLEADAGLGGGEPQDEQEEDPDELMERDEEEEIEETEE